MTKEELGDILNSEAFENKVTILARRVFVKSTITAKNIAYPFVWVIVFLAGYIFTNLNQTVLTLNDNVVSMNTSLQLLKSSMSTMSDRINQNAREIQIHKEVITQLIDKKLLQ